MVFLLSLLRSISFSDCTVSFSLSCLQLGTMMNNTAVNILCVSFHRHKHSLLLVIYPGMELLVRGVYMYEYYQFSKVVILIYSLASNVCQFWLYYVFD